MRTTEVGKTTTYTLHHPRWYRPRVSTYWWLGQRAYLKFVLRELSSIPVAWFVVVTLLSISAVARGPEAWNSFQLWLARPAVLAVNAVSLLFILFHTITWFNLTPQAMAVRVGGRRVPGVWIAAANYAAWLAVSGAIAWLVLRG